MEISMNSVEGPYKGRGSFLRNYMLTHDVPLQKKRMKRHQNAAEEPQPSRRASITNCCRACPLETEHELKTMLSGLEFEFDDL